MAEHAILGPKALAQLQEVVRRVLREPRQTNRPVLQTSAGDDPIPFKYVGSEIVPAYGVLEITSSITDSENRTVLVVDRPSENYSRQYLVNGRTPIDPEVSKRGGGFLLTSPRYVRVTATAADYPASFGPQKDSFDLAPDRAGFDLTGGERSFDEEMTAVICTQNPPQVIQGSANSDIDRDATGEVQLWSDLKFTARNVGPDIEEGESVLVFWIDSEWLIWGDEGNDDGLVRFKLLEDLEKCGGAAAIIMCGDCVELAQIYVHDKIGIATGIDGEFAEAGRMGYAKRLCVEGSSNSAEFMTEGEDYEVVVIGDTCCESSSLCGCEAAGGTCTVTIIPESDCYERVSWSYDLETGDWEVVFLTGQVEGGHACTQTGEAWSTGEVYDWEPFSGCVPIDAQVTYHDPPPEGPYPDGTTVTIRGTSNPPGCCCLVDMDWAFGNTGYDPGMIPKGDYGLAYAFTIECIP